MENYSIMSNYNNIELSPLDVISISFHMVMQRLLFTNCEIHDGNHLLNKESLDKFRTAAGIVFRFRYCQTVIQVQTTIISICDLIQIHIHLPQTSENWTHTVEDVSRYLSSPRNTVDSLSNTFNECVGLKLVQRVRQLAGLEIGLLQLPDDVIRIIFQYLDKTSVVKFSMVCKGLLHFGREKPLWLKIVKRNYQNLEANICTEDDTDFYELVASFEREEKQRRQHAFEREEKLRREQAIQNQIDFFEDYENFGRPEVIESVWSSLDQLVGFDSD